MWRFRLRWSFWKKLNSHFASYSHAYFQLRYLRMMIFFFNHSYDCRLNWTPRSPITIINQEICILIGIFQRRKTHSDGFLQFKIAHKMESIKYILRIIYRKALEMWTYEKCASWSWTLFPVSPLYTPYTWLIFLCIVCVWVFNRTIM